jgi:hypothetical protein
VLTVNGVTTHTPGKVTKSNDSIATPNISVITVQKYLKLATLGKMQKPKKNEDKRESSAKNAKNRPQN